MPQKLKVITQNCFFGKKCRQVAKLINEQKPDICCLQEVTCTAYAERIKKNTDYNYLVSKLGQTYFSKYKLHNAIFTNLPVLEQGEKFWLKKRKSRFNPYAGVAFWAIVKKNNKKFLIYNCHFNVRGQGMEERKEMITEIAVQTSRFNYPVIICGDMNTALPDKKSLRKLVRLIHKIPDPQPEICGDFTDKNEKYFFLDTIQKCGFKELADLEKNTWRFFITKKEMFNLKLDWMLYKNCRALTSRLGDWIGDHRSIIGELISN